MRAAGFDGIDDADISREEAQELDNTEANLLTASVFAGASALDPPAGLSSLGAGALGLLSWLNTGDQNPASTSRVIAWVPAPQADSTADARELFIDEVSNAFDTASADTELPERYRFGEHEQHAGHPWQRYRWLIDGPECGDGDSAARCQYQFSIAKWEYDQDNWNETQAPQALGGFAAYRIMEPSHMPALGVSKAWDGKWEAAFPDLAFYARVSDALPEWALLYLAPKTVSYRRDDGDFRFLRVPILLHQGDAHYFMAPYEAS